MALEGGLRVPPDCCKEGLQGPPPLELPKPAVGRLGLAITNSLLRGLAATPTRECCFSEFCKARKNPEVVAEGLFSGRRCYDTLGPRGPG